jgi:hypothetical protein
MRRIRPRCVYCNKTINEDEFYDIKGFFVHDHCLIDFCDERFVADVEDYIEEIDED